MRGRFITFEGIDGAGKTTQIDRLEHFLRSNAIEVVRTREPGGTPLGEKIRGLLLGDDMGVTAETLLFFAGRAEHVERVIRPALERGAWVLSDRFADATYAYQAGGKGVPGERVEALEAWTLEGFAPDRSILFFLPPAVAEGRRAGREASDRFERENRDFFDRVRDAYLERAKNDPERFVVVDASADPDAIAETLLKEVRPWL